HVDWVPSLNQTGFMDVDSDMQQTPNHQSSSHLAQAQSDDNVQEEGSQVRNPFDSVLPQREPLEGEKFLAYFPHSGFHNQRITLENTLRLAAYLNRTLLLPPLYLSKFKEGLVWKPPPVLEHQWVARNRSGVEYCRNYDPTDGKPALTKSQISHLPPEEKVRYNQCYFYHAWTVVPWTYFFDIPKVIANVVGVGGQTEPIRVFDRPNMTIPWLVEHLKIKDVKEEIFFFEDATRYHYKIMDDSGVDYSIMPEDVEQYNGTGLVADGAWKGRYTHPLLLSTLKQYPHRVLHFGSMYATDRVEAVTPEHKELKAYIEESMDLWNDDIMYATSIALKRINEWRELTKRKAPEFLGVHLRTADGPFIDAAGKSLERLRTWVRGQAQRDSGISWPFSRWPFATSTTTSPSLLVDKEMPHEKRAPPPSTTTVDDMEEDGSAADKHEDGPSSAASPSPSPVPDVPASSDALPSPSSAPPTGAPAIPEPNAPHNHPAHAPPEQADIPKTFLERCMGQPSESPLVFMSTDIPQPRKSEMLKGFIEEFPCAMFLSDFPESMQVLERLQNPHDGIRMLKYMVAMLDANIVARSRVFQGTQKSTFSAYIYRHMWPKYHNGQILEEEQMEA
ncbi:hypothetical protein BGZ73_006215, partial [Actinomortierella ambigua]